MRFDLTDVVKHLILINVVMFIGTGVLMLPGGSIIPYHWKNLILYYPTSEYHQPFQYVTNIFMHIDLSHLAFNMLSLFFLGPWLERLWGPKRFLFFYLACGLGAVFLHLAVAFFTGNTYTSLLGASGAVYGVMIGFAMLFPDLKVMLLIPPIPIKARYLALGLLAFDLFAGFGGLNTGIAHFAHIGGALLGGFIVWYWKSIGRGYS